MNLLALINRGHIFHIVGVGGFGMSAIAQLMYSMGCRVQGSDHYYDSQNVRNLIRLGVRVFNGHSALNIERASFVIRSNAVPDNNVEICEALNKGIPIISRSQILSELLLNTQNSIAVSGTHGKTTTTSMLGAILDLGGCEPTVLSGGIMNLYNDNVKLGEGKWYVVEADESDGTFTKLHKLIAVVTNIELDHIEYYKSYENLLAHFKRFVATIPEHGFAVVCEKVYGVLDFPGRERILTFGIDCDDADVRAKNIVRSKGGVKFDLVTSPNLLSLHTSMSINVPGDHNVCNALAAIAVAIKVGVPVESIKRGLQNYAGVKRRFSFVGKFRGADLVDDYAHHPTAIIETIKAGRDLCKEGKKVIAVIQLHRYSRLKVLFDEYINIPSYCSYVFFLPVYGAGEKPIRGVDSQSLALASKEKHQGAFVGFVKDINELKVELAKIAREGDMVISMGAGDITNYINEISCTD